MVGPVAGKALGTFANCSGGFTPWGTILSCEENVSDFYEPDPDKGFGWGGYYSLQPRDYGWVVETNPFTRESKKLTSLGRFAHEVALFDRSVDDRALIYLSDDKEGGCLYKFISKNKLTDSNKDQNILHEGELFAASLEQGQWLSLSPQNNTLVYMFNIIKNTKSGRCKTRNCFKIRI